MRLGCCGSPDQSPAMKDVGFDFVEVNVQAVLKGDANDKAWAKKAPDPDKLALPMEAANCLVPGSHKIVGPDRDTNLLQTYMQRVCERAKKLGIQRLVLGSGEARKRPDDVAPEDAFEQIAEFARIAGDAAAKHDVTIVIEHLNKGETNTINSLADEQRLIEQVDHPHVAALVDSYHYGLENESTEALVALGDRIQHVHVAEVVGRIQPGGHGDSPDAFDFDEFFCMLRKIGYDQRLSFEGKWTGSLQQDGPATVRFLRDVWHAAGRCES